MRVVLVFVSLFLCTSAYGEAVGHKLIRRVAVFPVDAPKSMRKKAEDTWWDIRKNLTDNRRFLVASQNFLKQKDVYQARSELTPADAIILSQLLDADALITTFVKKREIYMHVYEGVFGRLLWEQKLSLQPSIPIVNQIQGASVKLVRDFVSSMPYQGFVFRDSLKGETVYSEEGRSYFKAEVGLDAQIEVGDKIQLVKVASDSLKPLFSESHSIEIFAEGIVERVDREVVTVLLQRATGISHIQPNSLVRVPKELKRLKEKYALQENFKKSIHSQYFNPELSEVDKEIEENKPLITSLSFLGNLALFLILAL